jgi:hypothetical protein
LNSTITMTVLDMLFASPVLSIGVGLRGPRLQRVSFRKQKNSCSYTSLSHRLILQNRRQNSLWNLIWNLI